MTHSFDNPRLCIVYSNSYILTLELRTIQQVSILWKLFFNHSNVGLGFANLPQSAQNIFNEHPQVERTVLKLTLNNLSTLRLRRNSCRSIREYGLVASASIDATQALRAASASFSLPARYSCWMVRNQGRYSAGMDVHSE